MIYKVYDGVSMKVLTKKISCVIVALMVVSTILSGCRDIDDMGMSKADSTHEELIEAKGQYYRLYTGAFELD